MADYELTDLRAWHCTKEIVTVVALPMQTTSACLLAPLSYGRVSRLLPWLPLAFVTVVHPMALFGQS